MPEQLTPRLISWGRDLEPGTIAQAERASRMPFVFGNIALMPDAHVGIGATVGSVIPTQGAIIPSAVGVDIGCGMIAVRTNLSPDRLTDAVLRSTLASIEQTVPAGVGQRHASERPGEKWLAAHPNPSVATWHYEAKVTSQFGTLGSGNHFIEVCTGTDGAVWVVLHSGSRGVGNALAKRHIDGAKKLMKRYFIELEDPDLAYLVEGTDEFAAYMTDLHWAQDYALANREAMMDEVIASLSIASHKPFAELRRINCHHNYTAKESHCLTCSGNQGNANLTASLRWAETETRVRGFLDGCRVGFHSCGGLVLLSSQGDQASLPSLANALAHTLSCLPEDDLVSISEHNLHSPTGHPCSCHRTHSSMPTSSRNFGSMSSLVAFPSRSALESLLDRPGIRQELSFLGIASLSPQHSSIGVCSDRTHERGNIWVTRKGAIRARVGDYGVIPGSMGTNSFIVKGLGNQASFDSSAHGAGRAMSRTQARKVFTAATLTEAMAGKVWLDGKGAGALVDESPGAYKDINRVMEDQADLVEIEVELSQVLNYKGT